ncbi:MAG: DUF3999 family protein [Gammaproteobacteria bacterium]|nr:MAG: DUF3999 family protein [Gammaproteobacteria bacterium]
MSELRYPRAAMLLAIALMANAVIAAPSRPAPSPSAYAWGWPIEAQGSADYYEFTLPLEVYRSVADPELRDIGVFDARGEPVPRWIGKAAAPVPAAGEVRELTVLPVHAPPGTPAGEMKLALERRGDQMTVRIDETAPGAAGARALVAGIADLGGLRADLRAVELEWPREIEPLILEVSVEGSTDLQQWFALGAGTVAGLREADESIEQRRIGLAGRELRYLRLSWNAAPPGWRVTRLVAHFAAAAAPEVREYLPLTPVGRDAADGGWLYDAGAAVAVDRLALELPGEQGLLRANLLAWLPGQSQWQGVHDGLFYRLRRDGAVAESDPLTLVPLRARRWKLVIRSGRSEPAPRLRLGWQPDRILFVAQGESPWRLVAGSASDREQDFPMARRFSDPGMLQLLERTGPAGRATLGARYELGGPRRLEPPRRPEWRRWSLWIALIAGVGVVGGMAWRLLRQGVPDSRSG